MTKKHIEYSRILAILVILLAILYFYLNILLPQLIPKSLRIGIIRDPFNILILGTDVTFSAETRKPLQKLNGRADTILLVHINPIKNQISALSIPRDTYVIIPGYRPTKVNAANAYGGTPLMKETIELFVNKKIDYYLKIRPTAITKMVDLLGGVSIDVEKDMRYTDRAQNLNINLKKGLQKLSGKDAHDYIRFRSDYQGDIGRVARQQKFLKALGKTLTNPMNIYKAPEAITTALGEIETDLPLSKTLRTLNWSRMLPANSIKSATISGEVSYIRRAGSVWLPDNKAIKQQLTKYF